MDPITVRSGKPTLPLTQQKSMVHNVAKMKRPLIIVQLIHIHGPMKGEIQEFSKDVLVIGRNPSSDLCFPADLTIVSRKHAEIIREGNQFRLISEGANGTFVNGKKISEVFLKDGDVLEFADGGPKVSFLTQMKEDTDIEPPPQPAPQRSPGAVAPDRPAVPSAPVEPPIGKAPESPSMEKPPIDEAVYIQRQPQPVREPSTPPVPSAAPSAFDQQPLDVPNAVAPLVIQYGPTIRSYKELPVTLGRHLRCGFVLDHPGILDQHAQIFYLSGQYWVKDLTGQKMVQVNYQPIPFQAPLSLDDMVTLSPMGPVFRFIGEGRLAEVADSPAQPQSAERHQEPEAKPDTTDEKASKGVFSRLKKKLF
jgi:pSer/pThr/pTyr-binding forkhead associated (FHA) protein